MLSGLPQNNVYRQLIAEMKYCSVPNCKNYMGHKFPKDPALRLKWRVAIRRKDSKTKGLWNPGSEDIVCHSHFTDADYRQTLLGERKILKKDAVPSAFKWHDSEKELPSPRLERIKKREASSALLPDGVQYETEVVTTPTDEKKYIDQEEVKCDALKKDQQIQCEMPNSVKVSIDNFKEKPRMVNYYTGFSNYDAFLFFFHCLGPSVDCLSYKCTLLEPKDQLFLTLMKLRQAKEDVELSSFFQISEATVSRIIVTWINFLYFQLQELDIWPSKEVNIDHMPSDFGDKFAGTRVILDATELPVHKPSDVNAQSITWSSYKHKNTLKTMIGVTPKVAVSYISRAYGGSASDRQIIEKSELLDTSKNLFSKGDRIMADRGLMVQDLFAAQDVHVNTPTMLKGKSQLEPEEVVHDRRVASKRIHVERIIGLSKGFKILCRPLPQSKIHLGSRIVYVCFAISNFRSCIVDKMA